MTKKQVLALIGLSLLTIAMFLASIVMRYLNNQVDLIDTSTINEDEFSSVVETLAAKEDVTWITTWAENGQQFHFSLRGDTWICEEVPDFPVSDKVTELVKDLSALKSSYTIWEGETLDMYGLESPVATISYGTDKEEEVLLIGRTGVMEINEYCYAKLADVNVVYVLDSTLSDLARQDIYGWVNLPTLPVLSASDIQSATIDVAGYPTVELTVKKEQISNGYASTTSWQWYHQGTNVSEVTAITSFAEEIRALAFNGAIQLDPGAEDLSAYGFDQPTMVFTVHYVDSRPDFVLELGAPFHREESERDFYYCRTSLDEHVYYVKDFGIDSILALAQNGIG